MASLTGAPRVDVTVIGGGMTGLAAAHRLMERAAEGPGPSISILEASERLGGQVRTERHGGFLLEAGPDALVAQKPAGVMLCTRLGLGPGLRELASGPSGTQVLHRGRLQTVPEGFLMIAPTQLGPLLRSPLFSLAGKLRMLCEPFVPARGAEIDDESLASFVGRRFGREVLERVAEPVVASLFTADAARLSLRLSMPRFLDLESTHGSVTRGLLRTRALARSRPFGHGTGRSGFVALEGGLSRVVEALAEKLPAGCASTHARAVAASRLGSDWVVALDDGRTVRSKALLLTCPAHEAANCLRALDRVLADGLAALSYASCATVNLAYPEERVGALRGFGFFVPRAERLPILACSYTSRKFPGRAPAGTVLLRAFLGGATDPSVLERGDEDLVRLTQETLRPILAIAATPSFSKVYRAERAMPQFDVGYAAAIAARRARAASHPGLFLAGSMVGAFGIPDCIRSGEEAADRAIAFLDQEPVTTVPESSECVAYQANQNA